MQQPLLYSFYDSPIGRIYATASDKGITDVCIGGSKDTFSRRLATGLLREDRGGFTGLFKIFERYFSGKRVDFDVPLDLAGTAFQKKVLAEIKKIPYGKTISYAQLASRTGVPKGARAAGNACGANPAPIIIPCHRVLKSDGSIGGYTGGVGIKKRLLEIEGIL